MTYATWLGAVICLFFLQSCALVGLVPLYQESVKDGQDIYTIPAEDTWPAGPLPVAIGAMAANRAALAYLEEGPQRLSAPTQEMETISGDGAGSSDLFSLEELGTELQTIVSTVISDDELFEAFILDEESGRPRIVWEAAHISGRDVRYHVGGTLSLDQRSNRLRMHLRLTDSQTGQLIGTASRAGLTVDEAAEHAAEGILTWLKNDVRLYLIKAEQARQQD
ncbi:MAG: hypothetical protein C4520_05400 [Candidatus Abyssobacteria bacterium SURF_5]|uniref:Uncharacterized protein n=1 Tax=Abyssobacteria bacterium (strain SURF_5) TaxID=2093360 RepID=A0A3A4NTW6_ABYX5|nr:MAG: hypothetical protein C4520_05400 [Candidatus Abyssubacteria bacterium SURF_5]